jgi:hypothetical protein
MNKEPTQVGGIRLPLDLWRKLRALMKHHGGRKWLEKAIEREANKAGIE